MNCTETEPSSTTSICVTELEQNENSSCVLSSISRCMKRIKQEMGILPRILRNLWKAASLLIVFYIFTCSLDLLSRGFFLLNGRHTENALREQAVSKSEYLTNPVAGVMVGILITVLVHSSSTSTSIVVAVVAASNILDVRTAIPIIMGANIGTSITTSVSTIISFPKAGEVKQFQLAFSCATLHSMFNWCSVVVLIVTEHFTHYLEYTSGNITLIIQCLNVGEINFLNSLTKPAVNLIVQIDKDALACSNQNCSLIAGKNSSNQTSKGSVDSLFRYISLDDFDAGLIILAVAVISVVSCLLMNVRILKSILQGELSKKLATKLNAEIAYVPWLTEYLAVLFAVVVTILIQSSSVFTSTIAPLVGLEFLTLKRAYPLTLGANIGTTTTALITALAAQSTKSGGAKAGIQIALCHVLFNLTGVLIFYPIPYMRFPIKMAMYLGERTAMYRWFAVVFMALMFVIVPAIFMGLCIWTHHLLVVYVAVMFATIFLFITCINKMRSKCPVVLPELYKDWKWLPVWIRSLQPYDKFIKEFPCCSKAAQSSSRTLPLFSTEVVEGNNNIAFVKEE